ncbi:hypothetical protein ES319_D08G147700v1 [Gossypium barbadense]|uniref:Uncharacterized protein n=2 Tax=Gossypium TaxID=3633 RepID=A0A5J5QDW1_GOSBA|nr:hypothetical protein ES319_D08G147700v1 [Gossypium barbadense]TYG57618.1 hypothetical protein ES288_D08G157600v1 [Gossypium darwinii]
MVSASPSTTTTSLRFISIPISIACRHANASAAKGLDRSLNAASKINFNIGGSSGLHRSISIHRPAQMAQMAHTTIRRCSTEAHFCPAR